MQIIVLKMGKINITINAELTQEKDMERYGTKEERKNTLHLHNSG